MITAPQLFARITPAGKSLCFFCGGQCDETHAARDYVAESFTERDRVAAPGSPHVCGGCVQAMRSDLASVDLIDGRVHVPKEGGKRKPKPGASGNIQVRWFSWVVTADRAVGATPGHRELLRKVCMSPPQPPFAICIADGNKHQLFRTPVNVATGRISLNCEGVRVDYHPEELQERMRLTMRLVAVVGKGSESLARLADPLAMMGVALQLGNEYDDAAELLDEWVRVKNEPLTDLAIFLTPGKDEARERLDADAAAS